MGLVRRSRPAYELAVGVGVAVGSGVEFGGVVGTGVGVAVAVGVGLVPTADGATVFASIPADGFVEILDGKTIPTYDKPEQQAWRHWAMGLAYSATGQTERAKLLGLGSGRRSAGLVFRHCLLAVLGLPRPDLSPHLVRFVCQWSAFL